MTDDRIAAVLCMEIDACNTSIKRRISEIQISTDRLEEAKEIKTACLLSIKRIYPNFPEGVKDNSWIKGRIKRLLEEEDNDPSIL